MKYASYNKLVNNSTDLPTSLENLYLKQDYATVQKKLLENKDTFDPGVFHYNLGTLFGKQGNFPAARYNLEKSLKLGFFDSRLKENLQTIKIHLANRDLDNSDHWKDQLLNWGAGFPESVFFTWSLLWCLGILLLIRFKKMIRKVTITISFLLSILPISLSKFYFNDINYAINLQNTPLREGPSSIYPEMMMIEAGSKFIVREGNDGWFYIKSPSFLTGWVRGDHLAIY